MDPHNRKEAHRECALDAQEGADILMVPARKMESAVSHIIRSSSTSPAAAAALIIAYSPETE